jgi:hypothetical protein
MNDDTTMTAGGVAEAQAMKTCTGCKIEKPATAEFFNKDAKRRDGLNYWCKACWSEYRKAYRQTPKSRATEKAYRQTAQRKAYQRRYQQTTKYKNHVSEWGKKHRQKTEVRERIKAYKRTPVQKAKHEEYMKDYKQRPEAKARINVLNRVKRYKLTPEQYQGFFSVTNGVCCICRNEFGNTKGTGPVIDHCHNASRFRGIICGMCNTAIGIFRDNPDTMERAAEYVRASPKRNKTVTLINEVLSRSV